MKAFPRVAGGLAAAISAVVISSTVFSSLAMAGTEPYFNPLTQSSAVASPNHINEINSPWQTPAGVSQVNLTSMAEIEADINQSVIRAPGLGTGASMWDMVAFNPSGEFLYIPHETEHGAGVTRYRIAQDFAEVLFSGDNTGVRGQDGNWGSDWGAFDPATFTPYGTLLLGEEWSGEGRVMEVLNPYAAPENIRLKEKHSFANVSHEGIRFGKKYTNTVYFVDEDNSGSIYKLVASDDNFDAGQTFVLMVTDFAGNAAATYNHQSNANQARTGIARWAPLTSENGKPRTTQDPFENSGSLRPGRIAADQLGATPFGRPEDVEVGVLANGNEVLYFTATSEKTVYSVEMLNSRRAVVREFASEANTPKNLGFPATTGVIDSPDNLAQDAFGNIYVIEDAPNGGDVGGDIWFLRDSNGDGVAESVDHFMSIQVDGAEATGMIFNPTNPTQFVVSVQHPDSTDIDAVGNGQGDSLWKFDIADVIPPNCEGDERYNKYSYDQGVGYIFTCSSTRDFNFTRQLSNSQK